MLGKILPGTGIAFKKLDTLIALALGLSILDDAA
jgi:hypothetical protein